MIKVLVDENLSEHLADGLNAIQRPMDNGIEVVSMKNIFGKGTKDEDWIPKWGKMDGIFLTADINISRTRHLADLLKQNDFGAFFLKIPNKTSYWERVKIIIKHWPTITKLITTKTKPFAYWVTPNKVDKML
jgi:PIN like domain